MCVLELAKILKSFCLIQERIFLSSTTAIFHGFLSLLLFLSTPVFIFKNVPNISLAE